MARYIDADAFSEKFKKALENQEQYGLYNHAKITQYVIKAIENEPTADVVPKSEVAREIFEEADKIFMATCLSLETYNAWCELKKKYIGEQNDGNP